MKQIEELQERLEVIRSEAGCIAEVNNNARMREMLRGWHETIAACRERDEEIARLQERIAVLEQRPPVWLQGGQYGEER
jgi:hypothetical protein